MFGVAFGSLFRHEPLTGTLVGSTALVGLGIYLVSQGRATPVIPALASEEQEIEGGERGA